MRGSYLYLLLDGEVGPGPRTVTWNGRDHRGRLLPSGPYFISLSGRNFREERRVLIMR